MCLVSEWKDVENSEKEEDTGDNKRCDQLLLDPVRTTHSILHVADDCALVQPHVDRGEKDGEESE